VPAPRQPKSAKSNTSKPFARVGPVYATGPTRVSREYPGFKPLPRVILGKNCCILAVAPVSEVDDGPG
jgi:hypothetical protein